MKRNGEIQKGGVCPIMNRGLGSASVVSRGWPLCVLHYFLRADAQLVVTQLL
jgi:hypothetical protein